MNAVGERSVHFFWLPPMPAGLKCSGRDSNSDGNRFPRDFKSHASTSFATRAGAQKFTPPASVAQAESSRKGAWLCAHPNPSSGRTLRAALVAPANLL